MLLQKGGTRDRSELTADHVHNLLDKSKDLKLALHTSHLPAEKKDFAVNLGIECFLKGESMNDFYSKVAGHRRDVFISHAASDQAAVRAIVKSLLDQGVSVWQDVNVDARRLRRIGRKRWKITSKMPVPCYLSLARLLKRSISNFSGSGPGPFSKAGMTRTCSLCRSPSAQVYRFLRFFPNVKSSTPMAPRMVSCISLGRWPSAFPARADRESRGERNDDEAFGPSRRKVGVHQLSVRFRVQAAVGRDRVFHGPVRIPASLAPGIRDGGDEASD